MKTRRDLIGNPTMDMYMDVTAKYATRGGRWSKYEVDYLVSSTDRVVDDALTLKRTYPSVQNKIKKLRASGVVLARDGVAA